MKVEEFKLLKDGASVVWNGTTLNGSQGVFCRTDTEWWIKWETGIVTKPSKWPLVDKDSSWISNVSLARVDSSLQSGPVQVTITVTIPDGYEATGEFRQPVLTDHYVHTDGVRVIHARFAANLPKGPRLILRKKLTLEEKVKALAVEMNKQPAFTMYYAEAIRDRLNALLSAS